MSDAIRVSLPFATNYGRGINRYYMNGYDCGGYGGAQRVLVLFKNASILLICSNKQGGIRNKNYYSFLYARGVIISYNHLFRRRDIY